MTDETLATLLAPIAGENPGGADARYEPEYETLQSEIEKLSSITQSNSCNWQTVADNATVLLREKTKDYLLACYLAVALGHLDGVKGILAGSRLLAGMIEGFWQTGFPQIKRLRGRVNAFEWWRERVLTQAEGLQNGPALPPELVDELVTTLKNLDGSLGEVMPDFSSLRELWGTVSRLPVEVRKEPAPEAPQPESGTSESAPASASANAASANASASAAPASQPVFTDDMAANRQALADTLMAFVQAAHAADLADPMSWHALRLAVWGKLVQLPPADNGTTMLPAPPMEHKAALVAQIAANQAREAALALEGLLPLSPFWLDLQYLAAQALKALGAEFAPALKVVEAETRLLVERLPGIVALKFSDDTPFADQATQAWLASLAASDKADTTAAAPAVNPAIGEANRLYAGGNLKAALDALEAALEHASDQHSRIPLRVAQARLLTMEGQWAAATGLAEELEETCIGANLAQWDPDLAIEVLLVVRQAWDGYGGERGKARAWSASQALARIRPSAALGQIE